MNLLAKKLWPVFLLAILFSCDDPNQVGLDLNPDIQNLNFSFQEMDVATATIRFENLKTSQLGRLLVGRIEHDVFGITEAQAFTEIKPPSLSLTGIEDTDGPDSLLLSLAGRHIYGDGYGQPQKIAVHRITEQLVDTLDNGNSAPYYNNSNVTFGEKLGEFEFTVPEDRPDTLIITTNLEEVFSEELWEIVNDDAISTWDDFDKAINGLAFIPDPSNTLVFGANTANEFSRLLLYYSSPGDETASSISITLAPFSISKQFNRITSMVSSGPVSGLNTPGVEFEPIDGKVYFQDGIGLYPKLKLDAIRQFVRDNNVLINKAEIVFETVESFESGFDPSNFYLLQAVDQDNELLYFESSDNQVPRTIQVPEAINILASGNELILSFEIEETPQITANITTYIQKGLVEDQLEQLEDLIIVPFGVGGSVDQLVLNEANIKLRLFFTELNDN